MMNQESRTVTSSGALVAASALHRVTSSRISSQVIIRSPEGGRALISLPAFLLARQRHRSLSEGQKRAT